MKPKALKRGDRIGVISASEPITDDNIEQIRKSVKLLKDIGIEVKFGRHAMNNPLGYGETAKNKAEDINEMFKDPSIDAIFCAIGGYNCNAVFDYLDFEIIKQNPKIICGYSDPTSLINIIYAKTGIITFHGPNLKTLSSEETDYGFKEVKKRFIEKDIKLGTSKDEWKVVKAGEASGVLVRWQLISIFESNNRKI